MAYFPLTPVLSIQICEAVGLRVLASNEDKLAEWLNVRCHELQLSSPEAYIEWLKEPAHVLQDREALSQLLTSRESYFLRDQGLMTVLREHLLIEIMATKEAPRHLNIWSIGCSTGEEPYTLSILLEETIQDLKHWKIDILGSDIDRIALNHARQGMYRPWSFRGCPHEFMSRYFQLAGGNFQILHHVKQRVRFEQLDIVGSSYPTAHKGMANADIILCRNVFIYLDDRAIQIALKKITACLTEGGYLLCGPGEMHAQSHPHLVPLIFPQALVFQKKSRQDIQPTSVIQPAQRTMTSTPIVKVTETKTDSASASFKPPAPQSDSLALAWVMANHGNIHAANDICNSLIEHNRFDPHTHYLQAVLLLAKGDITQAREALRRVLYLDPLFAVAYVMLIDVCMASQDTDCVLKTCKQGLKATQSQPNDETVPYFTSVTFQEFRQHLQDRIVTLNQ